MYKIVMINANSNISYTIHNSNVSKTNTKVTNGSISKGINSIGSFTFTILRNNPVFSYVYPYTSLIKVYNTNKNKYEFIGRILKIKPNMSSNGLISKTIICEDRLGYLQDSIQPYLEEKYWEGDEERTGLEEFIDYILDNHNSQVDDYKKIYRGKVTVKPFEFSSNVTKGLNYETTWEIIDKKLIDSFSGEIQLREENGNLYLDYLEEIGDEKTTTIELKKNMQSVDREIDPTSFITRLIPLGAKIKKQVTDESGNTSEKETEERLTIASVNNGSIFLNATEINSLGSIVKTVIYDDVTDASNLLSKGKKYLEENNKLLEKHTIKALDLSLINKDIDDFEVGNYYPIKNNLIDLDEKLRIIKKTINILEPLSSTFDLGDSKKLLSTLTLEQTKSNNNAIQEIKKEYVPNVKLIEEVTKLTSLISQTSTQILLEVAENYTQNSDYKSTTERLANLILQVDSIKQTVSSWGDLTSTIEQDGVIELPNAMEGDIINFSIRGEINFLYPSNDLYPNDNLYPVDNILIIEDESANKQHFELSFISLHYMNNDVYDEFIVENNTAYLVQRIGIANDGSFYELNEEISTNLGSFEMILSNGTNKIYLPSFDNAHFLVKYVVKNAFSDIYATTAQLESSITQLADSINLVVSKKVGSDEIISSINQSAEEVKISAEKLSLEGKQFNLSADNINIIGNKLKISSDGTIELFDEDALNFGEVADISFNIKSKKEVYSSESEYTKLRQEHFLTSGNRKMQYEMDCTEPKASSYGHFCGSIEENAYKYPSTTWKNYSADFSIAKGTGSQSYSTVASSSITVGHYDASTNSSNIYFNADSSGVRCISLTQTSLKEKKKNIEKLENAISILNEVDIYKYNFKNESDATKKHIGFVIGDGYKYSKEITSEDNSGVDIYSMVSVLWQIVKEQQQKINKLNDRVDKLRKVINNDI